MLYMISLPPVQERGHYWVNIILSEASTYKSLSPTELKMSNVTQQKKSDQKWHAQNDLNRETVLLPSSNIAASELQQNKTTIIHSPHASSNHG